MFLNEIFKRAVTIPVINEGGNVSSQSPGWQGVPGEHKADEIDLKLHNRTFMVGKIADTLYAINNAYAKATGSPIWDPSLINKREALSGSTIEFFNIEGVSDEDFLNKLKKTKVGDIDTQVDQRIGDQLHKWLTGVIGKKIGPATFLGFNSSLSGLWLLDDPAVRVQIDFELGPYTQATDKEPAKPTEWFKFSHSSHLDDMSAGIKGVFHKWIYRAIPHAQTSTKYVARVLKKSTKISEEPVTDSDFSFAVTGGQGGGLSLKYKPYINPETGKPGEINGVPVMQLLKPEERDYDQNLASQFQKLLGKKPTAQDSAGQQSFVGTIQLLNKYMNEEQREEIARRFLDLNFAPDAQMITAGDPIRDRDTKFTAIDAMLLGGAGVQPLKIANGKALRQQAVKMAMEYEAKFNSKPKKDVAESFLREADEEPTVKAQLRKGMPHLRDLKSADFLDLLDEIHDGNGNFKLQNIPLNVKVDGFGGRFGKNAEGKPFMGTSRTEPRYKAGFLDYHKQKGTEDPEILGRAKTFDQLFDEMMKAVQLVDSKLGPDFLVNKQITCEVLFLPFATETDEGKLKFVGIHYDKLPQGVQLALVPFRVVEADSGEDLPDSQDYIKKLLSVGKSGSVMFIDNSLTQQEALDVTAMVPPLENIQQFKAMLASKKRDQAAEVKAALEPVKLALEKAIIQDPNILGKDILGKDYEGIVINSRLGPIKVTSQEQRQVIANKNAAKTAARAEQPRGQSHVAAVAIGSAIGHIGHQQLFNHAIERAKSTGGEPYFFIGNAEGKDDPIPVADKVKTWHMLYPQYAKNISAVTMDGGSLLQKVKHELINPLPGKPPRYDTIYIVVGTDRKLMATQMSAALMKAVNKFQGYEEVKVIPDVTSREEDAGGTGVSGTALRNALKTMSPSDAFAVWSKAFNGSGFGAKPLPPEWIKHLMDVSRQNMKLTAPPVEPHTSPSGAKTNMNPKDDDYNINYGKNGMAAQDKQQQPMSESKQPAGRLFNEIIGVATPIKEAMLPKKAFAGADKNKLGTAGQWRNKGPKKNSPAKAGDLVGSSVEYTQNPVKEQDEEYNQDDYEISNYKKLDKILFKLCEMVIEGQKTKPDYYGKVAAAVLDPDNNLVARLNYPGKHGRIHAERAAMEAYEKEYGEIPKGSIILTTLSPCSEHMEKRDGPSCTDYINDSIIKKVYCGYEDPTQDEDQRQFNILETKDAKIRDLCKEFADTFIHGVNEQMIEAANAAQQAAIAIAKKKAHKKPKEVDEEKQRLDPKCWKGYRKAGTKMKGGKRVNNCVPVSEDVESVMSSLIAILESK